MKYILLFLSIFLLSGCSTTNNSTPMNPSNEVDIVSLDESLVIVDGSWIFIDPTMSVSSLLAIIEVIDGSSANIVVLNSEGQPKQSSSLNEYEQVFVTSESGKYSITYFIRYKTE